MVEVSKEGGQPSARTRAKVVVSDFHLGEGRRHWDGSLNVLEDFTVDQRFVEFVDYFARAYDEVEIILNGNFFEMLRCRAVVDSPDVLFETYAVELVRVEMDGHPAVMDALKRLMENPLHRLVYLIGEADVGVFWTRVQQEIKSRISDRIEFYPASYVSDGIYVEHGHQYESMYAMDVNEPFRDVDGLQVLKLPWGAFYNARFVQPLRKIRPQFYRVRPMKNYLLWSLLFETKFFLRVVAQFLRMIVSVATRKLYPGHSIGTIFRLFSQAADSEVLEEYAEILLESDQVQKVVFGHSRMANYRQFRNGKEYFNSGSWTKSLSLDLRNLGSFHRLTYVLFEYRGMDIRGRLMEWKGRHEPIEDFV
jgi:UDP-2,3-diacylglucosamine pyrophosphatase LpxH